MEKKENTKSTKEFKIRIEKSFNGNVIDKVEIKYVNTFDAYNDYRTFIDYYVKLAKIKRDAKENCHFDEGEFNRWSFNRQMEYVSPTENGDIFRVLITLTKEEKNEVE